MNTALKDPLNLSVVYLWIGFVCAISFMEAWLKFKAPGVSLQIGLGIGKLVFQALNKVEWVLAIVLLSHFFISKTQPGLVNSLLVCLPVLLLLIQSLWLLPALDSRADLYLKGIPVPPSPLHLCFVGAEVLKVISLFVFSIQFFK